MGIATDNRCSLWKTDIDYIEKRGQSGEYPYPFRTSQTNADIARDNYPDSPVQRYVATALGDEIPQML